MGFDKRYKGEHTFCSLKTKQVCIRLADEEIKMLHNLFPDKNISFAIRTLIHDNFKKCNANLLQ